MRNKPWGGGFLGVLISFVCQAQSLESREVSNQIERPGCSLDVSITAAAIPPSLLQPSWSVRPEDVVVDVRVTLNGKAVAIPPGFSQALQSPTRVLPLRRENACGFRLQRSDASTASGVLEVTVEQGRIQRVERFDIKGRTTSITTFKYPGVVVLD